MAQNIDILWVCWTACSVQKSLPALHLHFTPQRCREVTVIAQKAIFAMRPKQSQTWLTFSFGGRSPPETFPEARQLCHRLCVYVFCCFLDPSRPLCWNLQAAPFRGISTRLCWLRESCRHNNIDHKRQTADLWVGPDSVGLDVESWPPKICDISTVLNERQKGQMISHMLDPKQENPIKSDGGFAWQTSSRSKTMIWV